MPKFRSKVVEIEAVQLKWENWSEVCELASTSLRGDGLRGLEAREVREQYPEVEVNDRAIYAVIPTLEGPHLACEGDWIVRGLKSELYPVKPDIFAMKYESA